MLVKKCQTFNGPMQSIRIIFKWSLDASQHCLWELKYFVVTGKLFLTPIFANIDL
jgi:hypothetical protein